MVCYWVVEGHEAPRVIDGVERSTVMCFFDV